MGRGKVSSAFRQFNEVADKAGLVRSVNTEALGQFRTLIESAMTQNPYIGNPHVQRCMVALRQGGDPQRMILEAEQRRDQLKGSPYTTVNGNFSTWDAIASALRSVYAGK